MLAFCVLTFLFGLAKRKIFSSTRKAPGPEILTIPMPEAVIPLAIAAIVSLTISSAPLLRDDMALRLLNMSQRIYCSEAQSE